MIKILLIFAILATSFAAATFGAAREEQPSGVGLAAGIWAALNAGKNGGAFHLLNNGLAAHLGQFPGRGVKIGKPLLGNGLVV